MKRSQGKGGFLLMQVSFLLLVLMGLAALVIDLGMARVTQGFLQSSADAASLDGLRFRDVLLTDPVASDVDRRLAASRAASRVHDEDLDLSTEARGLLLGGGPQFQTGTTGIDSPAGGLLVGQGPYLPVLQTNAASNEVHGDLVAGSFTALDPADPGNSRWHAEQSSYARTDFQAANPADAPGAPAFLARLRRTNNRLGLDRVGGVSSAGPTLPFLFGLGSGVLTSERPDLYDPRRDGLTVRATAIADARPAIAAGLAREGVLGVAPVALDLTDPAIQRVLAFRDDSWRLDLVAGGLFEVTVGADGLIQGTPAGPSPGASGLAQANVGLVRVGDAALAGPRGRVAPAILPGGLEGVQYVALYSITGSNAVISGLAAVRIDAALLGVDSDGAPLLTLQGSKLASLVAPENASAVPALATNVGALLPLAAEREPLLAPVLAR